MDNLWWSLLLGFVSLCVGGCAFGMYERDRWIDAAKNNGDVFEGEFHYKVKRTKLWR